MKPSIRCVELIKSFEGYRPRAYLCPAGVLTIGYGTTTDVKDGDTVTETEATALLIYDLQNFAYEVNYHVTVEMTQNQFDALCSFVYNCGAGNFRASTLLKLLNQGAYKAAAQQFLRWDKANGKVLPGLTKRRAAEKALFEKED